MKFDDAINYIAEATLDMEMAKPKNPEIEKLVAQGMPYYKARNIVNSRSAGNAPGVPTAPAARTAAEPAGIKYKELPDTLRTKDAVATYLQHNPGATPEEVMSAIGSQNSEETPLNLDPEVVKSAIADAQVGGGDEQEPDPEALRKAELQSKYDRVRQALYKMHGFKAKGRPGRKAIADEPETDPELNDIEGGEGPQDPNHYLEPKDPTEM
jgi:hypothetical protein